MAIQIAHGYSDCTVASKVLEYWGKDAILKVKKIIIQIAKQNFWDSN